MVHVIQADEAKAERTLAEESKGADKLMNRRALLLQKQEDCTRKIRDLGTVPSGHEKYKNKTVDQLIAMLEKVNTKLKKYRCVGLSRHTSWCVSDALLMCLLDRYIIWTVT